VPYSGKGGKATLELFDFGSQYELAVLEHPVDPRAKTRRQARALALQVEKGD
jgi:hypothetical protein